MINEVGQDESLNPDGKVKNKVMGRMKERKWR
jgi:hypothetical protein